MASHPIRCSIGYAIGGWVLGGASRSTFPIELFTRSLAKSSLSSPWFTPPVTTGAGRNVSNPRSTLCRDSAGPATGWTTHHDHVAAAVHRQVGGLVIAIPRPGVKLDPGLDGDFGARECREQEAYHQRPSYCELSQGSFHGVILSVESLFAWIVRPLDAVSALVVVFLTIVAPLCRRLASC